MMRKNYEEAETLFKEILVANPTSVSAYIQVGNVNYFTKNYVEAEKAYLKAIRISNFTD
jgi:tetratricopeptide (TPR) repeat protein